jgi:hypothetical protein
MDGLMRGGVALGHVHVGVAAKHRPPPHTVLNLGAVCPQVPSVWEFCLNLIYSQKSADVIRCPTC